MTNTLTLAILFLSTILTVHAQLPNSPQTQPPLNPSPQLNSPNSLANQQAAVISQAPSTQVSTAPTAQFTPAAQTIAVNEPSSPLAALSQQVGLSQLLQTAKEALRSATQNPPPQQPQQPAALNNPLPMNSNSVQTQQLPMMSNVVATMPSMNSSPTQPQQQAALINNAQPAMSQSNAAMTTNSPTASVSSAAAAETNPPSASVPQPTLSSSSIPNISLNGTPATDSATTTQSTAPTDNQAVETFQVNQEVAAPLNPPQLPRFTRPLPRQDAVVIHAANQQPLQTQQSLQTPSVSSSMFSPLPQQPGVESVSAPVIESAAQPHTRNDELVVQYDGFTQPIGLGVSRTPHFENQDNMIRRAYANQHQYALQLPNPQLQGLRDSPYPAPQVPPPAAQSAEGQAVWMQQQQQAIQDLQHVTRNPSQQLSADLVHTNMETNQASPANDATTSAVTQAETQTNNSN